jgi:hypothetical protein
MEAQIVRLRRLGLPILGTIALVLGMIVVGWQWVMIAQRAIRLLSGG